MKFDLSIKLRRLIYELGILTKAPQRKRGLFNKELAFLGISLSWENLEKGVFVSKATAHFQNETSAGTDDYNSEWKMQEFFLKLPLFLILLPYKKEGFVSYL